MQAFREWYIDGIAYMEAFGMEGDGFLDDEDMNDDMLNVNNTLVDSKLTGTDLGVTLIGEG